MENEENFVAKNTKKNLFYVRQKNLFIVGL